MAKIWDEGGYPMKELIQGVGNRLLDVLIEFGIFVGLLLFFLLILPFLKWDEESEEEAEE